MNLFHFSLILFHSLTLIHSIFVNDDQEILLIPSIAFRSHSNQMNSVRNSTNSNDDSILFIQGWLFRKNPFRAMLATSLLSTMIGDIDEKRVSYLTASSRSHQYLCLNGFQTEICAKTDDSGLFHKQFRIENHDMDKLLISDGFQRKLRYSLSTKNKDSETFGEIFLCDDNGISIITDIDDTIKITGVTNLYETLENTFSKTYKSVPGMAERYRSYQSNYNITFHYLTASPDQLFPFLREFIDFEHFPLGSFHMRHFTWLDSNFFQFFSSKSFIKQKTKILEMFFQQTQRRKFLLFGDIFQKDPEIYSSIFNKYSNRILKIFIRVPNRKSIHRLNQVFKNIPKDQWSTFVDGFDLPENLF